MQETNNKVSLTKNDILKFFLRWYAMAETSHSYERMQGLSVCAAFIPALKKLWKKEDDFRAALQRHLAYFNTEAIWGVPVLTLALTMEEEFANLPEGTMSHDDMFASINGVKTGLMGPLAGIGDTIDWATLQVIFLGVGMDFAMRGEWIGGIIPYGFTILTFIIGLVLTLTTYKLGKIAISNLFESGFIEKIILGTGIVGNFMMGSLGAGYVKLSFANEAVQGMIDRILPGIMPFLAIFAVYYLIGKRKMKLAVLSVSIIAFGIVTALIGLF